MYRVQTAVQHFKATVNAMEVSVDVVQPLIYKVESLIDAFELLINAFESLIYNFESLIDSFEPRIDRGGGLVESTIHLLTQRTEAFVGAPLQPFDLPFQVVQALLCPALCHQLHDARS